MTRAFSSHFCCDVKVLTDCFSENEKKGKNNAFSSRNSPRTIPSSRRRATTWFRFGNPKLLRTSLALSLFSSSLLPQIPLSSEGTAVDAPFETPDTQTLRQKKPALTPSLSLSLSFSTPPTKTTAATSAAALFGLGGGAATKEKTDTVYDFTVTGIDGNKVPLSKFKGKVLVIVNVASACGFTPQYSGFQELVAEYGRKGLEVLFFPCNQFGSQEPGSNADVKSFAAKQGFKGVMLAKVDVNGPSAEPLFQFMKQKQGGLLTSDIKWNFSKFLVDREGNVVGRYASTATPESLKKDIEMYL